MGTYGRGSCDCGLGDRGALANPPDDLCCHAVQGEACEEVGGDPGEGEPPPDVLRLAAYPLSIFGIIVDGAEGEDFHGLSVLIGS